MNNERDAQSMILEHSKAKVQLYQRYLSIYLNILQRAPYIEKVYLFDLFAGEGRYANNEIGSSIAAAETIKEHFFTNDKQCINIEYLINEPGLSQIEKSKKKIDRIKNEIENIFIPDEVEIRYKEEKYQELIQDITKQVDRLNNDERALLFIDPWGYKEVNFNDLKKITQIKGVELILFLPISFMYRFAEKSLSSDDFPGGESLENLLLQLFVDSRPDTKDQEAFINSIKQKLKERNFAKFVDTFIIEREKGQLFSLFFFTNHPRGAEKMLRAKWDLDDERGKGFRIGATDQSTLFSGVEGSNYPRLILDYITENNEVTNSDIYEFSLEKGFLPTHSNQALNQLKKEKKIVVESKDNEPVLGNYIKFNSKRKVVFKRRA